MKKGLLAAAIVVFGIMNINAQEISFGVKAGINLSTLYGKGKNANGNSSLAGWQFGGIIEYMFTENFGGQTEILYVHRKVSEKYVFREGYSYTIPSTGSSIYVQQVIKSKTYALNSINVPLLAKLYLFNNFHMAVGPQVNFNVSTEKQDMKKVAFGVAGGIGYELDMGLFLSARYYNGFTNLVDYSETHTYFLSSFQFALGYKF